MSDSFGEDEEDSGGEDLPPPPLSALRQRASVSAEAYGEWNKPGTFAPPVYPKAPEQEASLTAMLRNSFLFASLDLQALQTIVLAMRGPLVFDAGIQLITEGDSGDHLYVVQDGAVDCTKVINGVPTLLKTVMAGDLFGELALLYNCPRAASVISRGTVIWELDRESFQTIVMGAVLRKREHYGAILRGVPLFRDYTSNQLDTIIDVLKLEEVPQGTPVIQQGEDATKFFIVHEGQLVATRLLPDGSSTTFTHQAGDYFGELALMRNTERAATVIATSPEVKLLSMEVSTFKRLMGPMQAVLEAGEARYG
mmetsp:Transcript_30068/g.70086  ORF Transcript_30068/g.70086 Transcript_30068/m.70086 type:complete len:310 (-) Transcript_30068:140-1069(-)